MSKSATNRPSADEGRARLIKMVHVARRELERAGKLDEPGYRDLLRLASRGRHESSADMSYSDLKSALQRLKRAGFTVRKATGTRTLTTSPDASKVRALWLFLHKLDVVKDPSEQALAAYVRRIAKVDDLRWANGHSLELIESLKKWAMRFLPAVIAGLRTEVICALQAEQLGIEQAEHLHRAQGCLMSGEGFDAHWHAWESLMMALQRPVAVEFAVLRREASHEP